MPLTDQPLDIPSLALVGAGKMGQAMLEGWLARGLNARKVTVIEPQPAKAVKALARRGLKLNPKRAQDVAPGRRPSSSR